MTDTEVTITIPVREAAQQHIEHLQAKLTERNEQIERLRLRVEQAEAGEPNQSVLAREYQRGWKAACDQLMTSTQKAAQLLGKLRHDAFEVYLQAERDARAASREEKGEF